MSVTDEEGPKSVTYVLGTICHPCLRAGPEKFGGPAGIRTPDQGIMSTQDISDRL